ncbi:hypothetical protein DESUT3_17700 [Desulfuromonas versatilis]|uniref:Uncharacterized protein n=1 Tax=Desulfuromonas versatilis TaxID=2802975 RepID=A0ABN6DXK6_9BACT|nr:hypothetical protein [Desulfuromonas versatilis]BCR04701.1 hypothetical protein DESUT3_17700 [Desulfuromonas versatilis]
MKRLVLSMLVSGVLLLPAVSATAGDLRGTISVTFGGVPVVYLPPPTTVVVKEHHYHPRHEHRHGKHWKNWKHEVRHRHDCDGRARYVEKVYYDDGRSYRREKLIVRDDHRNHRDRWDY